jgi:hypothetical protein
MEIYYATVGRGSTLESNVLPYVVIMDFMPWNITSKCVGMCI